MKILVVAHDSNFSGGANRSLFTNLLILRDKYNVELMVLVPSKKGPFVKKLTENNICWKSIKYFGVVSGIKKDGKDFLRKLKVKIGYFLEQFNGRIMARKLKNEGINLVYTNTRLPMIGAVIAKKLGIPHVVHAREFGAEVPLWGRWDYKDVYDNSDKIIVISEALKQRFLEYVPTDKVVISYNGIDYKSVNFEYKRLDKKINLLITGRLVPDKGHYDALYALKELNNNDSEKEYILHIAGSSPKTSHVEWYKKDLLHKIKELHLENNVVFLGECNDMSKIRQQMDIELVCSIRETFGRVTVEGMRSGLFVIGSNSGGTSELIIDNEVGLLYRQGDSIDLADKIRRAIFDEEYFNIVRKKAIDYSSNYFTTDKNCYEIFNVLHSCIKD